ncbi:uncharacterized protein LOC127379588 isoform X1 [Dicentrarchus labrax]|uniref:uncharacterized protein LOC127379588 isoform X1 n=1 Tax=Dicentrarchus labrax TaxID=13489 RepID=UPI0021F5D0F4|nr:uncharacterized protein LOC127379588 isoform X1 [Dicentrarchus labrax]
MDVTSLCFRLLMLQFILLGTEVQNSYTQESGAPFLRITPDRLQHFEYESVSFHCEGTDGSTQLKWIKNTEVFKPVCDIKRTSKGTFCTIDKIYPGESGEYWCETDGGQKSNRVNITVTAGSVILDSPALPVMEGHIVTLCCRSKTSSNKLLAHFYKDGVLLQGSPAEEITINNVSKSDEGLYKCSSSEGETSPGSWLAVRANSRSRHEETLPDDSESPHVFTLLWIAVTVLVMALVLLLVGFLHVRKHRVMLCFSSKTPPAASQSGEDDQHVSGADSGVTYAVVITKQRKNKEAADAVDNLSPETNHSRKPQREGDDDESSLQPIYSTLKTSETSQTLQRGSYIIKKPVDNFTCFLKMCQLTDAPT